ncbi:tetratricopeptide repeat protein [Prochlorococcus marinus]|uniref:Uncharacterized protein n=1 Tax=Prochlorococcus marinus (strain MIT 9211) TaxID=93059 RepID=A9BCA1_PROM4|nr:tetratricopeptide repeat protein [Prochlorococcus marinus]ABX09463.1 Hypothetical protein P9211_15321 [Prochlorococcus marinus str. MIT 9211]
MNKKDFQHSKPIQLTIEDFSEAIELNPNDPLALSGRGRAKFKLGDRQGAIEDYSQAIELDPNNSLGIWSHNGYNYDKEENILFHNGYTYDEGSYCLLVLEHSTFDEQSGSYVLSDSNVIKLLNDHGAGVNEWREDCKRFNDPHEILLWLGY